jgi:hypothetical protein
MLSMNIMFAYLAPQPFLPVTSVLVIMVGTALMFRSGYGWIRHPKGSTGSDPEDSGSRHQRAAFPAPGAE